MDTQRSGGRNLASTARTIPYKDLPEADYAAVLQVSAYQKAWRRRSPAGLSQSRKALFDDSQALSVLIGRPTTPLSVMVGRR